MTDKEDGWAVSRGNIVRTTSIDCTGSGEVRRTEKPHRYCVHTIVMLFVFQSVSEILGQGPTITGGSIGVPELGRNESSLGRMPGAGGNLSGNAPDADRPVIGGAPGATTPTVLPSLSDPNVRGYQILGGAGVGPVPSLPPANLPLFGVLALPGKKPTSRRAPGRMTPWHNVFLCNSAKKADRSGWNCRRGRLLSGPPQQNGTSRKSRFRASGSIPFLERLSGARPINAVREGHQNRVPR